MNNQFKDEIESLRNRLIFSAHYEETLSSPPNWGSILLDLYTRMGFLDKFKEYLISPNIKLQREALKQDE